jgi:betaine reductase
MADGLRVVHYLNQFFGDIGGEDKALEEPLVKEGVVGPGKAVQDALKDRGKVVATVICGDNYFSEKTDEAIQEIVQLLTPHRPDIVIAGPAFNAGRYGVACGAVCKAVQEKIGVPAVTGMYEENPGVGLYKKDLYILRTADSVRGMAEAVSKMVNLAIKLANNQDIGRPSEEGYIARGIFKAEASNKTAAQRVIDMLLAKMQDKPFETEVSLPEYEHIKPAVMIKALSSAKIALVTDGGLVAQGNPDRFTSGTHAKTGKYSIKGIDRLCSGDYEVVHRGYDPIAVLRDPNRLIPLDVMRDLEKEGIVGKIHENFYATAGVNAPLETAKKAGQDLAKELKAEGVDGVILTST